MRKQFSGDIKPDPALSDLLKAAARRNVTEAELRIQRISFAFGNAPAEAENITKDSVKRAAKTIRLL